MRRRSPALRKTCPIKPDSIVAERLRDILAIIDHLQSINRSMLDRLRPMALGHVPLRDMLGQLISERAREHSQIAFSIAADDLLRGYGNSIDLTVYRCVQESLTNAIRHAEAKHVTVEASIIWANVLGFGADRG